MKKIIMTLVTTSCLALSLSLTGCPSAGVGGATPGIGTGTGGTSFATKTDFINFVHCLQAKAGVSAADKASFDKWVADVNALPPEQWALVNSTFAAYVQAYRALGC